MSWLSSPGCHLGWLAGWRGGLLPVRILFFTTGLGEA